jgi:hypothetical protein
MLVIYLVRLGVNISVYFLNVQLTTGIDTAVLESRLYNINQAVCLLFEYRISTPKVVLDIYVSNATSFNANSLTLLETLKFSSQTNKASWNTFVGLLTNGILKIQFIARIIGIIENVPQFVSLDHISINYQTASCSVPGELHFICLYFE